MRGMAVSGVESAGLSMSVVCVAVVGSWDLSVILRRRARIISAARDFPLVPLWPISKTVSFGRNPDTELRSFIRASSKPLCSIAKQLDTERKKGGYIPKSGFKRVQPSF